MRVTWSSSQVIAAAMTWEPKVWLFGGFAEDALLYGRDARRHGDIDLMVWAEDLPQVIERAHALGFVQFAPRCLSGSGRPLAVGSEVGDVNLEFCVAARTEGRGHFDFPARRGDLRMWFPDDGAGDRSAALGDTVVRTVSPLLLYQVREALADLWGWRSKDRIIQAALRERYFNDWTDADLAPTLESLVR